MQGSGPEGAHPNVLLLSARECLLAHLNFAGALCLGILFELYSLSVLPYHCSVVVTGSTWRNSTDELLRTPYSDCTI